MEQLFTKCEANLSETQKQEVKTLLLQHHHTFFKSDKDIGLTTLVEHTIDTGDKAN